MKLIGEENKYLKHSVLIVLGDRKKVKKRETLKEKHTEERNKGGKETCKTIFIRADKYTKAT